MDFLILLALFIGMSFGVVIVFFLKVKIPQLAKQIVEGFHYDRR